ncbi:MAG: carboxypeptidase-like regulatory domain-containing protein [Acidobacteriia bacterium]|nr:carboxypeptidase-like regulatory domain-containing protein [Terriglobia bacterium]
MKKLRLLIPVLLILLLLPQVALSQQSSSVTGIVTDSSGALIPGVEVKLTDTQTGSVLTTKTNELGVYLFVQTRPGSGYTLTFTMQGFQTFIINDLALGVGITETRNAQLQVGAVTSTIEVKAEGEATLNTTDASIGNVIDTRRMVDLPIQIRNSPAALMSLQPGVVGNNVGTTTTNRVGSVTGSRADQGNITVDGIDANDQATGQAFSTVGNAPIDSIQEFRTTSANPGAEMGRSSGGQIELVTKSGGNRFHGALREFNRTAFTAANDFFNNKAGIKRPALTRNQFGGSIGGPIKKDKLFFFFDYEGRRDAQAVSYSRTVPLDLVRNGGVAYINNNAGCKSNSRLSSTPNCITVLTGAQVAALDPKSIGVNQAFLNFINGRYPHANDLSLGDGINTGGFRFNAPSHRGDNTYTSRVDYQPTSTQKIFGRLTFVRTRYTDTVNTVAAQFPGDPESGQIAVQDYAWVVGHTWTLNPSMVNMATVGISDSRLMFPRPFKPSFPNVYTFGGGLSSPYAGFSEQTRFVPTPTVKDDFTWLHGTHNIQFGGSIKPIRSQSSLANDFNFVGVGLGGLTSTLDASLRPANILNDANAVAPGNWDSIFSTMLGRFSSIATNFNYSVAGKAFAPGTGKVRNFAYNEFEFYFQDTWKVRSDWSVVYGVRWGYYSPPYESNGFQATNDVDFRSLFNLRVANAANGVSGASAEPFLRYDLAGKANGARGYYEPDLNNFAPRLSFAYNPSFKSGLLGKLFGDRRTVIRGGGSVVYDRVAGALTFIQDQVSYLFDNSATTNFGGGSPATALRNDPRFTAIGTLPIQNVAPTITRPFTPFVDPTGFPTGNATGEFNYAFDQNFRTPYSIQYSLGIERELKGNFLLDVAYVGRQSRKLFTEADAAQALDFKDLQSGQMMSAAFNALQAQIQAGAASSAIVAQPWFENQISSALGAPCSAVFGVSCTRVVRSYFSTLVRRGDVSDTMQALYGSGLLNPNVGMSGQFSTNAYLTSLGASSYNGMLVSLRKRYSHNLQFDLNYTLSHSIDNQSSVANTVTGGLVCDITNLRVCRGNSDFDIRHLINANWVYDFPVGRGQRFGGNMPGWLNQILGGWEIGGIYTWRSGLPASTSTGSYPVGFNFNSPAVIHGTATTFGPNVHNTGNTIQFFADPTAALGNLTFPTALQIGNRNTFRGLGFWNVDLSVLKNWKMPWSESHRLQLRWESYNFFNHNSFGLPNLSITSSSFGLITGSASSPRVMQFALRYDF